MGTLKTLFASLFLAQIIYLLGIVVLGFRFTGQHRATGLGAIVATAASPLTLAIGLAAFVASFLLFRRYP